MFQPRRKEGLRQSPKEGKENWKMFVDRVKIHVKSGDERTSETISLTAPDEDEYEEEEGSSKLRGFFKKKK